MMKPTALLKHIAILAPTKKGMDENRANMLSII
jgi:hypothetical protein